MEMKAPEQQGCEGKSKWPFQALLWSQVQQNSPGDEVINFCPSKSILHKQPQKYD